MWTLINRILCFFGWCSGQVEHQCDENGIWWVGLRCYNTGTFHCPIKSVFQDKREANHSKTEAKQLEDETFG